jgi:hypothetical protein
MPGYADERLVVILDGSHDFLAIGKTHTDGNLLVDQPLEILYFFEGMLWSASPGFSAVS